MKKTDRRAAERSRLFKDFKKTPEFIESVEFKMCKKKHPYESERIARKKADIQEEYFGYKLRVYKCDICKKWHLTKKEIK